MCWAQMAGEEELWTGIPTVIQEYTVAVLLDAVRIRWDDNNAILLSKDTVGRQQCYPAHKKMVYEHIEQYIQVYTGIISGMYFDMDGM